MTDKSELLRELAHRGALPVAPRRALWPLVGIALGGALLALGIAWAVVHARSDAATARDSAATTTTAPAPAGADARGGTTPTTVAGSGQGAPPASTALLDATGYIVARRKATVSAPLGGRVLEVLISEGAHVKAGEVLARLDDGPNRLQLVSAQAQLAAAQAQWRAAQVAYGNAGPIYQRMQRQSALGFLSPQDLDTAKAAYDAAKSNLDVQREGVTVAQAAVAIAERNLSDTVIRAPFAGVITEKNAQPGEIISPGAAGGSIRTGIGTIVDMDSLEVEVDVSESYINRVQPEQRAEITLNAYPDWCIPGRVIALIPTADRAKATVKVRVGLLQRNDRVLPDMAARVAFLGQHGTVGPERACGRTASGNS